MSQLAGMAETTEHTRTITKTDTHMHTRLCLLHLCVKPQQMQHNFTRMEMIPLRCILSINLILCLSDSLLLLCVRTRDGQHIDISISSYTVKLDNLK